ncbi:hypothetical protein [Microseira sp. BLCC-F43]|jgi:hypothetical protein|uniref:hypothetical protein n=1 Tax=Microseira sp. BLCC-F43 TaxID=3153602 RepID=UPI0035B895A6
MKSALQIDDITLAECLKAAFNHSPKAVEPVSCLGSTYVALRHQGRLLKQYWLEEGELFSAVAAMTPALSQGNFNDVDTIELCLTRNYRRVSLEAFKSKFPNTKRGIRGIKLQYQSYGAIYSPTQMIADNLSFKQVFKRFLKRISLSAEAFEKGGGAIFAFEARQILVSLQPPVTVTMMYRGNQVVPLEDMSRQTLADMVDDMAGWLLRVGAEDGSLPNKYLPGKGKASHQGNLTCQFMATLSLIDYARFTGEPKHLAVADRNLHHNLAQFCSI